MCETVQIKSVKYEHGKQLDISGGKCGSSKFPATHGTLIGVRND